MAFDATDDVNELNNLFKVKYASKLERLYPQHIKLFKSIPFNAAEHTGKNFQVPVVLSYEHGVTYAKNNSGAFALEDANPAETALAQVDGTNIANRCFIGFEDAKKAVKGEKAFENAVGYLVQNLSESTSKRLEIQSFHGQTALAIVASVATESTTASTATIASLNWAPGIWMGQIGASFDIYAGETTAAVKVGSVKLTDINLSGKSLTFGRIDGDAATNVGTVIDVASAIYFKSARISQVSTVAYNEFRGLKSIISESTKLFDIDNASQPLFRGNDITMSGAITLGGIEAALEDAISKGLDEDIDVYLNPLAWSKINSDLSAKRRFEGSSVPAQTDGAKEIMYYYQGGMMKLIPHTVVKELELYAFPKRILKKVGASELTFNVPGIGERFFLPLSNNMGYELRCWAHVAIFCDKPGLLTRGHSFSLS